MASTDISATPQSISAVWATATATAVPEVSIMLGAKDSGTTNYERRVSSTILEEEYLEKIDTEAVRYIEVPEYVDVPKYVTKKSVVEVEKRVPKYEVEYIEKVVEVPEIKYVDKFVEVQQVHEVVKHVPSGKKEVVEVTREIVKTIPKIEHKVVERVVEIPGEVIEVPKPYTIENKVYLPQYVDKEQPVVICQSVHPYLQDSPDEVVDIDVVEHAPQVIEVEVQVPKPVAARIWSAGMVKSYHKYVKDIPAAQYNTLLKMMNSHLVDQTQLDTLPYMRDNSGQIQMLANGDRVPYVDLPHDAKIVHDDSGMLATTRDVITEMTKIVSRNVSGSVKSKSKHSSSSSSSSSTSSSSHQSSSKHESRKGSKRHTKKFDQEYRHSSSRPSVQVVKSRGVSHSTGRKVTTTSKTTNQKKSRACGC